MANGSLPTGSRLADYEIEGVLGEPGGFGITYRARDQRLQRQVAIKEYFPAAFAKRAAKGLVKPKDKAAEQIFAWGLERFIEEARTLAQFGHPNIVRVLHLIESQNGTAYIVMELVTGRTLEAMVEEDGVLDEARFRPIFEQMLSGCDAIHGIGIIHRDIKPSNIIVRANGEAVLIDFGAARDLALERRKGFTAAIVADGYSPPEQYSMKAQQDARSDIYALAATAYFAHTGEGPTPASARAGGDEMPAAAVVAAGKGRAAYLKAMDHALELKADRRPSTVAEWRAELAFPGAAPVKATLDRRGVLAIAGGATILAGVGGVMTFARPDRPGAKSAIDGEARPLKIAWTTDISAVIGMPYSSVTVLADGPVVAAHEVTATGDTRMLAVKLNAGGAVLATWRAPEVGSLAKAVWAMPDGGVLLGGDIGGGAQARVVRLDRTLRQVWQRDFGAGSVSCFLGGPSGVGVGIEGAGGAGLAQLIFIDDSGAPVRPIQLIDQATDAVQKAALLPSGDIIALGRRLRNDGRPGSQLWVARVGQDGESAWRKLLPGLGITTGWGLAIAGDDIFVTGTTRSPGQADTTKRLLVRFSGDGTKIWERTYGEGKHGAGRALALRPGRGKPALYVGGSESGPPYIAQLDGAGDALWASPTKAQTGADTLSTVESLAFGGADAGFASAFVQSADGAKRLVVLGLSE